MATRRITARYRNGVFVPDEEVELEEGCQATLDIVRSTTPARSDEVVEAEIDAAYAAAGPAPNSGNFSDYLDWLQRLQDLLPAEVWDGLPSDGARNYKHYLHGHPKEEE